MSRSGCVACDAAAGCCHVAAAEMALSVCWGLRCASVCACQGRQPESSLPCCPLLHRYYRQQKRRQGGFFKFLGLTRVQAGGRGSDVAPMQLPTGTSGHWKASWGAGRERLSRGQQRAQIVPSSIPMILLPRFARSAHCSAAAQDAAWGGPQVDSAETDGWHGRAEQGGLCCWLWAAHSCRSFSPPTHPPTCPPAAAAAPTEHAGDSLGTGAR